MFNAIIGINRTMTDEEKREYIAEHEGKRIYEGEQDVDTAKVAARKDLDRFTQRADAYNVSNCAEGG